MSLPRTSNRKLENETSRMEATPPVALLILTDPVENVLMKGIEKSSPGNNPKKKMEAFRVPRTRNEQDDVFPTHFLIGQDWYSESDVEDTMNLSSVKEHLNGHNSQLSCALIVQKSKMLRSVERSVKQNLAKQLEYTAMIEAYLWNGCAEEAKALNDEITKTWYPPHHAVLACSPHLAINVNKAGAERNPTECDQLIQRPLSNKYIDDLVVSCDKESEVIKEMECSVA
ncbi:hypothetical protein T4D_14183 [Trichinella pseudospiralis]|uniref:Uncharacterized protein n=1 Tax=Trichinella pseudospiralis TaxID=6337 RepID=A0A0V1G4U0_TRIPS|nr:hypothetical protein T4D_14183 [Trichinella pseudospiralis]